MTGVDVLISHVVEALLTIVVVGLCLRDRARMCVAFFAYAVVTTATSVVITLWPGRFWEFTFYSMKETVLVVLKMLVAVEIWQRTFWSFDRARLHVGVALVATLLATAAAVLSIPADRHPYDELMGIVMPRQQAGVLALYAIVVGAASWYRVPLHPLHRAILVGFGCYLTMYTLLLSFAGAQGGSVWAVQLCSRVNQAVYASVASWWVWAAWRPLRVRSPIAARLQPWASSW